MSSGYFSLASITGAQSARLRGCFPIDRFLSFAIILKRTSFFLYFLERHVLVLVQLVLCVAVISTVGFILTMILVDSCA